MEVKCDISDKRQNKLVNRQQYIIISTTCLNESNFIKTHHKQRQLKLSKKEKLPDELKPYFDRIVSV